MPAVDTATAETVRLCREKQMQAHVLERTGKISPKSLGSHCMDFMSDGARDSAAATTALPIWSPIVDFAFVGGVRCACMTAAVVYVARVGGSLTRSQPVEE